jgi:hypothetical protein
MSEKREREFQSIAAAADGRWRLKSVQKPAESRWHARLTDTHAPMVSCICSNYYFIEGIFFFKKAFFLLKMHRSKEIQNLLHQTCKKKKKKKDKCIAMFQSLKKMGGCKTPASSFVDYDDENNKKNKTAKKAVFLFLAFWHLSNKYYFLL